jgi:hypothetical protein
MVRQVESGSFTTAYSSESSEGHVDTPDSPSGAVARDAGRLVARLIPKPGGQSRQHYYHYDVEIDGEVVRDAWEPAFECARVLAAKGITGSITFIDGVTGKPRFTLTDIEKGAKLTVRENRRDGPCLCKWQPFPND